MANTKEKKEDYFYSEGYVYKSMETICKLYGNDSQNMEIGNIIVDKLNN